MKSFNPTTIHDIEVSIMTLQYQQAYGDINAQKSLEFLTKVKPIVKASNDAGYEVYICDENIVLRKV